MNIPTTGSFVNGPNGSDSLCLKEPLGGGAFGVVFKAIENESNTLYAVKFPQATIFGGERELVAFLNEVSVAGQIV